MVNIVNNPGAKTGTVQEWETNGWVSSSESPKSGSYSFYYAGTAILVKSSMSQSLSLTINYVYTLSFWQYYGSSISVSIDESVIIQLTPGGGYKYFSANFTAGSAIEILRINSTVGGERYKTYLNDISVSFTAISPLAKHTTSPSVNPTTYLTVSPTIAPTAFPTPIIPALNLVSLTSAQGFSISGANAGDFSGYSVSGADINGDAYDDTVIGCADASPFGRTNSGMIYIVFGKAIASNIILPLMKSIQSFAIYGAMVNAYTGVCVFGARDISNDKYDDIIFGASCTR